MKNFRENKGITLIALIITIVVLLIIAGISISGGIEGIDKADDNRAMSDLEKVQHAITERYTKFELLKDKSLIVGTKVDTLPTLPTPTGDAETPTWKVKQVITGDNVSPHPERNYYRLSKSDLENLGLTGDYKKSSYIVNYYTGEVFDENVQTTSKGNVLYKTAIDEEKNEVLDGIVLNNLIACYDAINNTGNGHSDSITTWKDLSGNGYDGVLTNVTMGNSYAQFNGTNSWTNLGNIRDYTNQITLEATINVPTAVANKREIICNQETGGVCLRYIDEKVEFVIYLKNVGYVVARCDQSMLTNKKYHIVGTYNGSSIKIYINGIEQNDITLYDGDYNPSPNILDNPGTINRPKGNTVMALGCNPIVTRSEMYYFKGNIYSAKIYNRALSANEVKQNYNYDRSKYGIEE